MPAARRRRWCRRCRRAKDATTPQQGNDEQVTADRIEYNDQRERQLNNYENKLRERNQIITQKEYVIQEKLKELDRKEKKYQDLLEREKQLDLREQRLNVKSGG